MNGKRRYSLNTIDLLSPSVFFSFAAAFSKWFTVQVGVALDHSSCVPYALHKFWLVTLSFQNLHLSVSKQRVSLRSVIL